MATERIDSIFDIEAIARQVKTVRDDIKGILSEIEGFSGKASQLMSEINNSSSLSALNNSIKRLTQVQQEYMTKTQRLKELSESESKLKEQVSRIYKQLSDKIESVKKSYDQEIAALKSIIENQKKATAESQKSASTKQKEAEETKKNTDNLRQESAAYKNMANSVTGILGSRGQNIALLIKEQAALSSVKSELSILNKTQESGKQLSDEQKRKRIELINAEHEHKQAISELNQVIKNDVKLNQAASGSMTEISQSLSKMRMAYRSLTEDERNSPFGQELLSSIQQTDSKIKELDATIGNHQRSVGDYENSIRNVISSQSPFIAQIMEITKGSSGLKGGFEAASKGVASFGKQLLALLANPVVLILAGIAAAIKLIVTAMNSSEEATTRWSVVMAPLNRGLNFLLSIIQKGLGFILTFVEAAQNASMAMADWAESLPFVGKYIKEMNDAQKEAIQLEKDKYKYTLNNRKLNEEAAEVEQRVAELRAKVAQKDKYTSRERIVFLDEAIKLETDIAEKRKKQAEENLRMIQLESNWADNDAAVNEKLSEAKIAVTKATTDYNNKIRELNAQRSETVNRMNAEEKAERDAIKARNDSLQAAVRELEDLRNSMISDDFEKQRAELNANYNKQIEDLKKKLSEDKNLTKQSREVINQTIQTLEEKRLQDLQKINEQEIQEQKNAANERIQAKAEEMQSLADIQQQGMDKQYNDELKALAERYSKGEITGKEYEFERAELSKKYAKQRFENEIANLEQIVNLSGLQGEDLLKAQKELNDKKIEYEKYTNDEIIKEGERLGKARDDQRKQEEEAEKELAEKKEELMLEAAAAVFDIINSVFERRIQNIDLEIEKIEERKEAELAAVEDMDISDEEREARKTAIEKKAEQQQQQLEKKKKQEQRKQAIVDRANAVIQSQINTALAITNALSTVQPFPVAIAMAAVAAAMGTIQMATILAQPMPQYAAGTEDHPGGLAVVGDAGKKEVVVTPQGEYYVTPAVPTVMDLPKHSQVLPDLSEALMSMTELPAFKYNIDKYNPVDYERLEGKLDDLAEKISSAIEQNKAHLNISLDRDGLWSVYDKKKGTTKYINERLNFRN